MNDWDEPEEEPKSPLPGILLVGVIILTAIAMMIFVPRYFSRVRTTLVRQQMIDIHDALMAAVRDNPGYWPNQVWDLEDYGYLTLDESIVRKWDFSIEGHSAIKATSTDEMSGGPNKEIILDLKTMRFYGYGFPKKGKAAIPKD